MSHSINIPKNDYIKMTYPEKIYAYGEEQEPLTWTAYINRKRELVYVSDTMSNLPSDWIKLGRVLFDDPDISAHMQMYVCIDTLRRKYPYIPFITNIPNTLSIKTYSK